MSFFQELKQRNVVRVALLYLVGAWLILQVADVLSGVFQLPASTLSLVATVLAIAFIPALVLAWVFELTPEGIKRESGGERNDAQGAGTGKRMTVVTIALLVVAIGLFLSEPLWRSAGAPAPSGADRVAESATSGMDQTDAGLGIAVLPFENLSADADNAFFAGGVHEEVMSNLSLIDGLRVISRTSMLRIAATDLDVRGIGERLAVSHVLEGSVRRSAERVRVSVQLIDANDDEQIWSESYEATLDDIFEIQTDIAQQIAASLRTTLTPEAEASMAARPTDSQPAYDLYLRARLESTFWQGRETFTAMRVQLEEALRLDPDFVEARVMLLEAYGRLYWLRRETTDDVYAERAAEQLALIEASAPTSIAARKARAIHAYLIDYNYEKARTLLEPLHAELPNNADILSFLTASMKRLDDNESFLEHSRKSFALDPEAATVAGEFFFALVANGLFEEAMTLARTTAQRFPEDSNSLRNLVHVLMFYGEFEEAGSVMERIVLVDKDAALSEARPWIVAEVQGVPALLEGLKSSLDDIGASFYQAEVALVLRQTNGDETQADSLSSAALDALERRILERLPYWTERAKARGHAGLAYAAAVAGNSARYARHREAFDTLVANKTGGEWSNFELNYSFSNIAYGQALLGDPEGGWSSVSGGLGLPAFYTLVFRKRSDFLFGSVPAYQEFVRRNAPVPVASGDELSAAVLR